MSSLCKPFPKPTNVSTLIFFEQVQMTMVFFLWYIIKSFNEYQLPTPHYRKPAYK